MIDVSILIIFVKGGRRGGGEAIIFSGWQAIMMMMIRMIIMFLIRATHTTKHGTKEKKLNQTKQSGRSRLDQNPESRIQNPVYHWWPIFDDDDDYRFVLVFYQFSIFILDFFSLNENWRNVSSLLLFVCFVFLCVCVFVQWGQMI